MRPRKDPKIRREAFVSAARRLLMERGLEGVSVRDVLDEVGVRSSSPSVFYHYFSSKDELYRAVVETVARAYVSGFDQAFGSGGRSLEERLVLLLDGMEQGMAMGRKLIAAGGRTPDHLFILDMREHVTRELAGRWSKFLVASGLCDAESADARALFVAGGMGQLAFSQLVEGEAAHDGELVDRLAGLAMAALGLPDGLRARLAGMVAERREVLAGDGDAAGTD